MTRTVAILMGTALALCLVITLKASLSSASDPTSDASFSSRAGRDCTCSSDEGMADLSRLEIRVEHLEDDLRAVRQAPMPEPEPPESLPILAPGTLSTQEFRALYGTAVMEILADWAADEDWKEYRRYIEERVHFHDIASRVQMPYEAQQALIALLSDVRRDAIRLESQHVKGAFPPAAGTVEYELWIAAWKELLLRWNEPVRRLTNSSSESVLPRAMILDMASPQLRPRL